MHTVGVMAFDIAEQFICASFKIDLEHFRLVHCPFRNFIDNSQALVFFIKTIVGTNGDLAWVVRSLCHQEFVLNGSEVGHCENNFSCLGSLRADVHFPLLDTARDFV